MIIIMIILFKTVFSVIQPVAFVTFESRVDAEDAKASLQVQLLINIYYLYNRV